MVYPTTWVSGGTDYPLIEKLEGTPPYTKVGEDDLELALPVTGDSHRADLREEYIPRGRTYRKVDSGLGKVHGWFNWRIYMDWPAVDAAGRGVIAGLRSHGESGGVFKVWPHQDCVPDRWFICHLIEGESEPYLKDRYIGYGPLNLVFEALFPVKKIYVTETRFSFCQAGGGYGPEEVSHFGLIGGGYTEADNIALFDNTGIVYHPLRTDVIVAQD